MAFTKEMKATTIAKYEGWVEKSQAIYVLAYSKMNMKTIDGIRSKIRDAGGEIHVVKNTLFRIVLDGKKLSHPKNLMEKSNIIVFAFGDPAAMAKLLSEATKNSEIFQVKGGFLGTQNLSSAQVKSLAELPPLPVVRASLLGMLQAPAGKLVRTLAEPARSMAGVVKAYSEKEAAPVAG